MNVHEGGAAVRHYSYYRPTILALLRERASYGYELASRMTDLGFDKRLTSSLYGVLRVMENDELITSAWDMSHSGGPLRRVYVLTAYGEQVLRDSVPGLVRQHQALGAVLDLYSAPSRQRPTSKTAAAARARRAPDGRAADATRC